MHLLSEATVSCCGNAELNIRTWYEQAFPKDVPAKELERFNVAVFTGMAVIIKPLKKLGRVGLVFRLVLVIFMSYSDVITDVLVIKQYGITRTAKWVTSVSPSGSWSLPR